MNLHRNVASVADPYEVGTDSQTENALLIYTKPTPDFSRVPFFEVLRQENPLVLCCTNKTLGVLTRHGNCACTYNGANGEARAMCRVSKALADAGGGGEHRSAAAKPYYLRQVRFTVQNWSEGRNSCVLMGVTCFKLYFSNPDY